MHRADYLLCAELRQQVSHGFTLRLPETLTAPVTSRRALGMTGMLFRAFLIIIQCILRACSEVRHPPQHVPVCFHV